jgi:hypothetical protein
MSIENNPVESGVEFVPSASTHDSHHDLRHFLRLATLQLRHRLKTVETNELYSERVRRMRILEELLKEQAPDENPRSAVSTTR